MKLKHLALVTVTVMGVLLPSAARAVEWVKVGSARDLSAEVYVDRHSLKRRGNTVNYWVYYVFSRPVVDSELTAAKILETANCATGDYSILREIDYVSGRVRSDQKGKIPLAAAPGTLAHVVVQSVCQR